MSKFGLFILVCIFGVSVYAQKPEIVLPVVHSDMVDHVFLSADNRFLIGSTRGSVSSPSEVKVWEVRSKKLLYTLPNNAISKDGQPFSIDGKRLLTDDEQTASVWNIEDGSLAYSIKPGCNIGHCTFSHDGKKIALDDVSDNAIKIYNADDGHLINTITDFKEEPYPAVFSTDDKMLCTVNKGNITMKDALTGITTSSIRAAPISYINHGNWKSNIIRFIKFTTDGQFLITNFYDSTLFIWDFRSRQACPLIKEKISDLASSQDGNILAVIVKDSLKLYNLSQGKLIYQKAVNRYDDVFSLSDKGDYILIFSPDKNSGDFNLRILDIGKDKVIQTIKTGFVSSFNKPLILGSNHFLLFNNKNEKRLTLNHFFEGKISGEVSEYKWKSQSLNVFSTDDPNTTITSSADSIIRIWDLKKGNIKRKITIKSPFGVQASHDLFLDIYRAGNSGSESDLDTLLIRNLYSGELYKKILIPGLSKCYLSSDNKFILCDYGMLNNQMKLIDVKSGNTIQTLKKPSGNPINEVTFLPVNKIIISDQIIPIELDVYDLKNSNRLFKVRNAPTGSSFAMEDAITKLSFSKNGKYLSTRSNNDLVIWDMSTQSIKKRITEKKLLIGASQFSPDNKYFMYGLSNGNMEVLNGETFMAIKELKVHSGFVSFIKFSENSNYILTAEVNGKVILWETASYKMLNSINIGPENNIMNVNFDSGIITVSTGAMISLYNIFKQSLLYSFASLKNDDYIFLLPDNYYSATAGASPFLSWKKSGRLYGFQQWDLQYNRPDKVLQAVGCPDSGLINAYKKAYNKRMAKLNIDTSSFNGEYSVPNVNLVNSETLNAEQVVKEVNLNIQVTDSTTPLKYFNIWVNGNPLYGMRGINIRNRSIKYFDTTITINLSEGSNMIETSALNIKGRESYKLPLYIKYIPPISPVAKTYFIGIGINNFADNKYNLQWSVKDIRGLAIGLKEKVHDFILVDTLFNERVTAKNIQSLKIKLRQTTENDKVIVAYSGHGLLSDSLDYYLSTYNVNFKKPEQEGLPYDALENLLDSIPARNKLMLIDACHSGEVDKEEMLKYKLVNDQSKGEGKGTIVINLDSAKIGMKNSFELMQELFVNVGRSTGATIISAAGGTQFARESGDLKNGVFTYSILEYMKDHPSATVTELKNYVNKRVPELTKGLQQPTSRTENKVVDWSVW